MAFRTAAAGAALVLAGGFLGGCAALDAAAVAETHRLDDAPYYVDVAQPRPAPGACALVLPVGIDPELREVLGYGDRLDRLQPIVDALNARLAARDGCLRGASVSPGADGAPRIYVGTSDSEFAPPEAEQQRIESDRFAPMVMHVQRPAAAWQGELGAMASAAGKPYAIAIQLGVSQYGKGYSGVFRKEVVLGTGNRVPIRFLTAEDRPVEVLHLTGVLLDATGRPVRAGAEGIILRDTPFHVQVFDVTRILDDVALERVLQDERREDLPGSPLKLEVALDNLLAQLTRSPPVVPAT
jgi:hypothetical protein